MLTHSELLTALHYDPETGFWTCRVSTRVRKAGTRIDKITRKYFRVGLGKKRYLAHRLAWFYMTGEWPSGIDHKDGDGFNNRWENLREATQSQNMANARVREGTVSGVKGVAWDKNRRRWYAYINFEGKMYSLGRHATFTDAVRTRQQKAKELYGEFIRHA